MRKKSLLKKIVGITVALSLTVTLLPQKVSAENPIVQNVYTADPAPMAYGDTLYLYTSHDEDELVDNFYTMFDWKCYSTKDMVNWTDHGTIMSKDSFKWAEDRAWAPQCVERDGKFYLYVPIHKKNGGMVIGVGVSDNPEGPFEDAIGKPLVDQGDWNNIDPTVYIDDDGQAYLYFGNPKLRYVKLNDDMISYDKATGIVDIDMNVESFGEGASDRTCSYGEGPWFYKRNNLYYMVYAAFAPGGGSEHLAYSTSTSPTGPWKYQGVIMPSQGGCFTNHPGVVDFMGHSYLFYHNQALPGGGSYHRSVCVEEFTYNEDGTFPELNMTKEGPEPIRALNPYDQVEAETFSWGTDVETENCPEGGINVCNIKNGSSLKVRNIDFGEKGPIRFHASAASEGEKEAAIELRVDSEDGPVIGEVKIADTGSTEQYQIFTTDVERIAGVHDLYLCFTGSSEEELFKFDYWYFEKEPEPIVTEPPVTTQNPAPVTPPPATQAPVITPEPGSKTEPGTDTIKVAKVKGLSVKSIKGTKAKVKWSKVKGAAGYELRYSTDKKLKKKVKKITTSKTTYTVKKLKKGKTCYFKVRAYKKGAKGKKIYGSFSSVKKMK